MKQFLPQVLAFLVGAMSPAHGDKPFPSDLFGGLVVIDYENYHDKQSTTNKICIAQDDLPKECRVPDGSQKSDWEFAHLKFTRGRSFEITIEDENGGWGTDAFLIDQIKVRVGKTDSVVGANNGVGWCLSGDNSDHEGFGDKAYLGKCCAGLKITADSYRKKSLIQDFSWKWTHCSTDVSSGLKSVARVLKKHIRG